MALKQLSSSTLGAIANLICGDDDIKDDTGKPLYPYYRSANTIKLLFNDAGVSFRSGESTLLVTVVESRYNIAFNALKALNEPQNLSILEKLLVLLASPIQYPLSPSSWRKSIDILNRILAPEGLRIYYPENGVIPVLIPLVPYVIEDLKSEIQKMPYPKPDFSKLTDDKLYSDNLDKRWDEIILCVNSHAYLSSIVMMGGLLEGILLSIANNNPKDFNTAPHAPKYTRGNDAGQVKQFKDWTLNDFIIVAHELGWISKSTKDFSDKLRDYRNLIHPLKNIQQGEYPDVGLANICLTVVDVTINEIISKKSKNKLVNK
jgi:hypothetical protein